MSEGQGVIRAANPGIAFGYIPPAYIVSRPGVNLTHAPKDRFESHHRSADTAGRVALGIGGTIGAALLAVLLFVARRGRGAP